MIGRTYHASVMHFSKTYTQVLEGLPPELRNNAIQYRQVCFIPRLSFASRAYSALSSKS
jgi:hypothetical protein